LHGGAVKVANFVQAEVLRDVKTSGLDATFPITPTQLAELLALVDQGKISGKQAKEVYAAMVGTDTRPADVVRDKGMTVMADKGALRAMAEELVRENPKQVAAYRGGKTTILGFFVGQM